MTTPVPFGQLPQSKALLEADPASLGELFSRDPEGFQQKDLDQIIGVLREQRERFAKAEREAQAGGKKVKNPKAPKVEIAVDVEDLGL